MTQFERLDLLIRECGGTIQTFQVINNGISKPVFYAYVKERGLEQVAHGVYVSPDTWTDAMYILHLRCSQAVFSHETALFFHDLTDREPLKYSITVKTGYNPSRLQEDGFQVYTVKKELHELGTTMMQTSAFTASRMIKQPVSNQVLEKHLVRSGALPITSKRHILNMVDAREN